MNAQAVSPIGVEETCHKLWHEWLSGWFDGAEHTVAGQAITFPQAELAFDQSDLPQPLGGVGITVVGEFDRERPFLMDPTDPNVGDQLVLLTVVWTFYVRARADQDGQGNSRYLARRALQLLRLLIQNDTAKRPLAQKGIFDLRPIRASVIPATDYATRMLRVRGEVNYQVEL